MIWGNAFLNHIFVIGKGEASTTISFKQNTFKKGFTSQNDDWTC